jgi:putative spermidine/putrescine transport system permease protein
MIKRFGAWPAWLVMAIFLGAPLSALVPEALEGGGEAFKLLWRDTQFMVAVRNTLLLGLISGVLSALIGTAIAIELARQSPQRRQFMLSLLGLPLAFSGLVIA